MVKTSLEIPLPITSPPRSIIWRLGAAEFLTKPVEFDGLREQLRQLPNAAD
jgi:hypothetical protein